MQNLSHFFTKIILLFHIGFPFLTKFKIVSKIAALISIPAWLATTITQWSISNQQYIAGVLVCIAIDHFIGTIYHAFKLNDFTFKKNISGLLNKLALCAAAAILFEVIHNTVQEISFVYDYLKTLTRLIIVLYPAGSAFLNMSAITNGVFPPVGWVKKIAAFNKNLDLENLLSNGSDITPENKITPSKSKTGSAGSL